MTAIITQTITAAVVAHPDRAAGAQRLARDLRNPQLIPDPATDTVKVLAGAHSIPTMIFMDNDGIGCDDNHLRAWEWLFMQDTGWLMILEDDALPIPEFNQQAPLALAAAPTPVVSFYLGRTRPAFYQGRIAHALVGCSHPGPDDRVDTTYPWVVCDRMLHTVGLAVRREVVATMMPVLREFVTLERGIDTGMTAFFKSQSLPVAYTVPSLVDHADDKSLAVHNQPGGRNPVNGPRVAWATGKREHWSSDFRLM